jgi:hypothetical protein
MGPRKLEEDIFQVNGAFQKIRAADAKEVGVENPAEETYRYPNQIPADARFASFPCQSDRRQHFLPGKIHGAGCPFALESSSDML